MPLTTESGVKIRHTRHGTQYINSGELLSKKSVQNTLKAAGEAFELMSGKKKTPASSEGQAENGEHESSNRE